MRVDNARKEKGIDFRSQPKCFRGIQPAGMIARDKNCRGFMFAMAVLLVLLALLLFFAWSRKRDNPQPEPPLHAAAHGIWTRNDPMVCQNSCVAKIPRSASGPHIRVPPLCPICNKPLQLETQETDENRRAVHEECYSKRLLASRPEPNRL